jgi:hypothetical protein
MGVPKGGVKRGFEGGSKGGFGTPKNRLGVDRVVLVSTE